jgi:hypothetical protein
MARRERNGAGTASVRISVPIRPGHPLDRESIEKTGALPLARCSLSVYFMNIVMTFRARVKNGRLTLDEPTDLRPLTPAHDRIRGT